MCGVGWNTSISTWKQSECTFLKTLEKFEAKILEQDIDSSHRVGNQGCTVVKFLRRKDCQQVQTLERAYGK